MPGTLLLLGQSLSGSGQGWVHISHQGWIQVSLLVFLFLIVVFKPERIYRMTLFKVACFLFVGSIVVDPVLTLFLSLFAGGLGGSSPGVGAMLGRSPILFSLVITLRQVLFGASMLLAFMALFPNSGNEQRTEPARHPLDQTERDC